MERPAGLDGSGVIPMGTMELIAVILAVAGGISTLAGAANWLVKLVQVMKAPNAEQDRQLAELKEWRKGVDRKLANDNERLNAKDEGDRVTQLALLALLAHGIDGNHQSQMEDAKKELEKYLIKK